MDVVIREAQADDVEAVRDILLEAAAWLRQSGKELWREDEFRSESVASDIEARAGMANIRLSFSPKVQGGQVLLVF